MYSQVGSRGEPWTAVSSPSRRTSGRLARYARALSSITSLVQPMARAASGLNHETSTWPMAAPSWLPITLRAPIACSAAITSLGCGPYPTMSPRAQTSSTSGMSSRTASRAARLAWMSDRTASRMGCRCYLPIRGVGGWGPRGGAGSAPGGPLLAHHHEGMAAQRGGAGRPQLGSAAAQLAQRPGPAVKLVITGGQRSLPREQRPADREQRQRQLGQHRQGSAGARSDQVVPLAVGRRAAEQLGAICDDRDIRQAQLAGHPRQHLSLLAHRIDQDPVDVGSRQRQRDARHAAARAQVDCRRHGCSVHQRQGRQRVEQVQAGDLVGVGDAGQVQPAVGLQQQRGVDGGTLDVAIGQEGGQRRLIGQQRGQRATDVARLGVGTIGLGQKKMLLRWRFGLPGSGAVEWPAFASAPHQPGYRTRPPGKQDLDISSPKRWTTRRCIHQSAQSSTECG